MMRSGPAQRPTAVSSSVVTVGNSASSGTRRNAPTFVQNMILELNAAQLTQEARTYILTEAAKLFGGGVRQPFRPGPPAAPSAEKKP